MRMRIVRSMFVWLMIYASIFSMIVGFWFCKGCLEEERNALLQIKESINSPEGSAFSSWYGQECCQWDTVQCRSSASASTVVKLFLYDARDPWLPEKWYPNASLFAQFKDLQELHLEGNNIGGFTSPSALKKLKHLQMLYLQGNYIEKGSDLCWGKMQSLSILNLAWNNLQGKIPRCLCEINSFTQLDLSHNKLHGDIDACFSNMSSLQKLVISANNFNGRFPSFLFSNLTNIESLFASDNNFTGRTSLSVFANLSKLSFIDISFNDYLEVETESPSWLPSFNLRGLHLRGCNLNKHSGNMIPSFISTQYQLEELDLSYNSLVGSIPSWMLYNVTSSLWLRGNNFSGSLPWLSGNTSSNLVVLDISDNKFHGTIFPSVDLILPNLYEFNASLNHFEGDISHLDEMRRLQILDLSRNRLDGEIHIGVTGNMTSLQYLDLSFNYFSSSLSWLSGNTSSNLAVLDISENQFHGTISPNIDIVLPKLYEFHASLSHFEGDVPHLDAMRLLQILDLSSNRLDGEILIGATGNMTSLQYLDLSLNNLHGEILPKNSSLPKLKRLHLRGNMLSQMNPDNLFKCSSLVVLDVRENDLSGELLTQLPLLPSLTILLLRRNQLRGQIPEHVCQLKQIRILDLSKNNLSHGIPSCLDNITWNEVSSENWRSGAKYIRKGYVNVLLLTMSLIDLSCNQLTGAIPTQIGKLRGIHVLNLSNNLLTGNIPPILKNMETLEGLDLSRNQLSGVIPPEIGSLAFLSIFNVSYNSLSGTIPTGTQLQTFGSDSYVGNPGLCGLPLETKCSERRTSINSGQQKGGLRGPMAVFPPRSNKIWPRWWSSLLIYAINFF